MAIDHERIDIDPAKSMGQALLEAIDYLALGSAALERLNDATAKMVDYGPPAVYDRLHVEYGCALEDAQELYNLIVGATSDLSTPGNISNLVTRVDQG